MESTTADARWEAVRDRDARFDGSFFYGVTSTRIVCRPGCAARRPLRKNTVFFDDIATAYAAGFRPCGRCKPDRPPQPSRGDAAVRTTREILDQAAKEGLSGPSITLAALAKRCGVSPFHLQRHFKREIGLSPKAYLTKRRALSFRDQLRKGGTVLQASYEAGFAAPSRAYAAAHKQLGVSPGDYRRKGAGMEITFALGNSVVGPVLVAATKRGICAVSIGADEDSLMNELKTEFPLAEMKPGGARTKALMSAVLDVLDSGTADHLPLDVRGSAFQFKVWDALRRIPAGETRTYGEIAQSIGMPKAARAVGRACATNAAAVIIPCHRAVRGDGGSGEYRWGARLKRELLDHEARRHTG